MKKNHEDTGTGFRPKDSEILLTAENKDGKPVNDTSTLEARDYLNKALSREEHVPDPFEKQR